MTAFGGYSEFEFDLPDALLASIIRTFDSMDAAILTPENAQSIPDAQGVYLLLKDGKVVYVGKTDSEAGLARRLGRHARRIQHRHDLVVGSVQFKAIRVFVFTAVDLETQLIRHYRSRAAFLWNSTGFGSNDPGRQRDTTKTKADGFDTLYPIDLDRSVSLTISGSTSVASALQALRRSLPYTIRWESDAVAQKVLDEAEVQIPDGPLTARSALESIVAALPSGWQATALAGRIILYRENKEYLHGTLISRNP